MSLLTPLVQRQWLKNGQSYWAARFLDRERFEWECDWAELNRKGLHELRLHCPNGSVAVLGNTHDDIGGRVFQLHAATSVNGVKTVHAQLIGLIIDSNGTCVCWAWDYTQQCLVGQYQDNVECMHSLGGTRLALSTLRL